MTVQDILQYLQDDINSSASDEQIWRSINSSIRKIAKSYAWSWLRRIKTVTTTDDATQGILMPANMVNVIDPVTDSNKTVYERTDASLIHHLPTPYRQYFYLDAAGVTPLAATSGVSIDKDTTALTFDPVLGATDYTGEFIRLTGADGEDWGVHEMASNTDLVNAYRGKRISDGYYILRPSTCKRISFVDYTGSRIGVSLPVHYWIYPDVLLATWQELPDVWEQPLKLLAGLELTTVTYDKKSEAIRLSRMNQYKQELSDAQGADGKPAMIDQPLDNTGRIRSMGWRGRR